MDPLYAWIAEQARQGRLPEMLAYPFICRGLLATIVLAPLLGGISHLVVARRMAFFSAALGHAALTGLTIGLALGEPISAPYGGILGFCLICALGMTWVRRRSELPPDTLIGVFLALSLGLGICLLVAVTKRFNVHQIEAVMFGSLLTVTDLDILLLLVTAAVALPLLHRSYDDLLLDSLDPTLARSDGARPARLDYLFVVVLTVAIVVSLKVIGALLVESLVVVPAAAARNLARSARGYLLWSIAIAFAACTGGLWVSTVILVPSGGAIVLALAAAFFATLGASLAGRRLRG